MSDPTAGCSWPRWARSASSPSIRRSGAKTVIASNLDIGLAPYPGGPPALVPTGVAVGRTGTVYVSSDIRNALYKLTPPTP